MKEPWTKHEVDAGTRYEWWRFVVTNEQMWGHPPGTWHVLFIGCGIHQADTPEEAINFAEKRAAEELWREVHRAYKQINDAFVRAQQLGLRELQVPA